MNKNEVTIAVLGGMGTYATINLFRQYAEVFPAEKEWDRPRIVIDNRCTMPSRVRAYLYKENVERLVSEMSESIDALLKMGGVTNTSIIIACNTAHLFLDEIANRVPVAKERILNVVKECVAAVAESDLNSIYLLASEGTIESGIYQKLLGEKDINCIVPNKSEYAELRKCIEAVKQNTFSDEIESAFLNLIGEHEKCILGCTELPVLYDMYKGKIKARIYDPCLITLKRIKREYYNE